MFSRGCRVANGLSTRIAKQNQIKCALDEVPFNVGVGLFFHRSFTLSFGFCVTSGQRPFFAAAQVCFCR